MATVGCLGTNIYQAAITASGRHALIPDSENMSKLMALIDAIKSGDQGDDVRAGMESVARALIKDGADVLIAGCTEIPIVFEGDGFDVPVVASTNVLARRTVEFASGLMPLPNK